MMAVSALPLQTTGQEFDAIYSDAHGDVARIPWPVGRPCPALITWLNVVAPTLVRCGGRVLVVGCGLGDDAREVMRRGYDVTAFDCSRTAIGWAKSLDPVGSTSYVQADLFRPPLRWRHRFDLVIECNNLAWFPPDAILGAASALVDLMSPHGHLLVVSEAASEPAAEHDGPPWPLTEAQLLEATALAGLKPADQVCVFGDDDDPEALRLRALFRKA